MTIKEISNSIFDNALAAGKKYNSVFFVGCGGSFAAQYPAYYFLAHESATLSCAMYNSNEFVHATPKSCGENSIVILCSMRGTAETCVAAQVAKQRGATVVSFYVEESDMTRASDYTVKYTSIADDTKPVDGTNGVGILAFACDILHHAEGYANYEKFQEGLAMLDGIYRHAKAILEPEAVRFGTECKDDSVIYVMGAGPCTGAAYIFSICNLMEMQWIHSPTVNFAELVHGPFETVDPSLPIVCLVSTGRTRPVDMRAMKFLNTYGKRLYVLDADEIGVASIDSSVAEYFAPLVFSGLLQNLYLHTIADTRNHPISTRRYMWKVAY